jgi:hypothetical protein
MITTRQIEMEDGAQVRIVAMTLAAEKYPELIPDIDKMHGLVRKARLDGSQFARVVGEIGDPRAALIALISSNTWAMRSHATVMLWYSQIPGAGAKLLREFRDWVHEHKNISAAGFHCDWEVTDERPLMLAERIGFKRRGGGAYLMFPRGRPI